MKTLILKKAGRYYGHPWAGDYVVLDGSRVIGRVLFHPQAPKERSWSWTITVRVPNMAGNRGYAATRLQAMTNFKARWFAKTVDSAVGTQRSANKLF